MDIVELIMADHHEQRRMFALLDEVGNDPDLLEPVWKRLSILLEVHASAEERLFYPRLLAVGEGAGGADDAEDETKDAIRDHDDIRDGIRRASQHPAGSSEWWRAVADTRIANSDHMGEEEREALADFRRDGACRPGINSPSSSPSTRLPTPRVPLEDQVPTATPGGTRADQGPLWSSSPAWSSPAW